jgi:DNA-directed RNA polymerase III subunit RPC1
MYCGAANGVVKKSGPLKISHEPYRAAKNADLKAEYVKTFATKGASENADFNIDAAVEDMNPLKVLELFKRITSDVSWLGCA